MGTPASISWTSTGSTKCDVSVGGSWILTNGPTTATNYPVGNINSATLVTVKCWNSAAVSDSKSVTFTPTPLPPLTIVATNIVCDDEAKLPNWGLGGGPTITSTTATNYVAAHPGCILAPNWKFQWGYGPKSGNTGTLRLGVGYIGEAGGALGSGTGTGVGFNDWKTFGPTNASGVATVQVADLSGASDLWVREALQAGYAPFTYGPPSYSNADNVSGEVYCADDTENYDDYDAILSATLGTTYYCVGFNALTPVIPTGTLILPSSCVINAGASTCSVTASWTTFNASGAYLWDQNVGAKLYTANSSLGSPVWVAYPQTVFALKNGDGTLLTPAKTVTASCAAGSTWNGSSCVAPQISVTALGDYGPVAAGDTKDRTITIMNTGGGTLNVTDTTDISASPHFVCTSGCAPLSLAGGASSPPITIRLTVPAAYPPGALPSETIRVTSNAVNNPQDVSAWATVIPVISINPGPLDFGSVILKKCSVDKALTINNNSSTVTVPAGSISVAAPFSCATSCDYPAIPPGGSSVIMMRYCPTALGAQTGVGTLSTGIQDNTGNLQGTGLPLTFKVIEK
jgi:hypothetical protein